MSAAAPLRSKDLPAHWRTAVHLAFIALGILAFVFTRERLYADAAYYLLHSLDSGMPWVDHQRFSLVLAELPPVLALHAGAPLSAVLVVHSLGHVFWAWLAAFWCMRLHRTELAVGILLLQVIGQTHLYYSPMMEICYGGTFALVLLAYWQAHPLPRGRGLAVWSLLAVLLVTSHPEHLLTLLVVTGLVLWSTRGDRRVLLLALLPIAVFLVLKLFFLSPYESGKFSAGSSEDPLRWLSAAYLLDIAGLFISHYADLLLVMGFGAFILFRARERAAVAVLLGGSIAVVLIVNTAMEATTYTRYHESAYFPLVTCGVLLGTLALPHLQARGRNAALLLVLVILVERSVSIAQQGALLKDRVARITAMTRACDAQGAGKCVIAPDAERPLYGTWEWSLPMEALLLSAEERRPVSLITTEDLAFDSSYAVLPDTMILLRRWEPRSIASLPSWARMRPAPYRELTPSPGTH